MDGSQTLAERRAEIRRRKILEQGNERMRKILSNGSSLPEPSMSVPGPSNSTPKTSGHPLPGRDLAYDQKQRSVPVAVVTPAHSHDPDDDDAAAAEVVSRTLFEGSLSPDEISDQLSNLSLGVPNMTTSSNSVASVATNLFAQSMIRSQNLQNLSRTRLLIQLLLVTVAAAAGVHFNQSILTSFAILQPVMLATTPSSWSLTHLKRPIDLIRTLFDNFLVFIFMSVFMKILEQVII